MSDKQNPNILKAKTNPNKLNINQNQLNDLINTLKQQLDNYDNLIRTFLSGSFINLDSNKKAEAASTKKASAKKTTTKKPTDKKTTTKKAKASTTKTKKATKPKTIKTTKKKQLAVDDMPKSVWDLIDHSQILVKETNQTDIVTYEDEIISINEYEIIDVDDNLINDDNNQEIDNTDNILSNEEIIIIDQVSFNDNYDNNSLGDLIDNAINNENKTHEVIDVVDSNANEIEIIEPINEKVINSSEIKDNISSNNDDEDDIVVIVKNQIIKPVFTTDVKTNKLAYSQVIHKGETTNE